MRVTYRNDDVKTYWSNRWGDIPADLPMKNHGVYPLKYAELMIKDHSEKILEAGCGAGRILRYYHNQGIDITGIDYIPIAIEKLKKIDSSLQVEVGSIENLRFEDQSFKYVLAFGLYHNLESGLDQAVKETYRILQNGGSLCASFRADNLQTKISDWLVRRKIRSSRFSEGNAFHKMNLTRSEFIQLFVKFGFHIVSISPVENMPILYRFSFFRSSNHKLFDENLVRSEGYCLSWLGKMLQYILMRFFPNQFCNIYVLIANKI